MILPLLKHLKFGFYQISCLCPFYLWCVCFSILLRPGNTGLLCGLLEIGASLKIPFILKKLLYFRLERNKKKNRLFNMSFHNSESSSSVPYQEMERSGRKTSIHSRFKAIEWFTFSVKDRKELWWDPIWWTSLLLEIGFIGFSVASFIVILQVETIISRAWIFWIFYIIQTGLLTIHTFVYAYIRLYRIWISMSIHQFVRIHIALFFMWAAIIFSIAALSQFISLPVVPPCCTQDIPGLTTLPLDIPLFLQWQLTMALVFFLNLAASLSNLVSLDSLRHPERKLTDKELRALPSVYLEGKRRDREDRK